MQPEVDLAAEVTEVGKTPFAVKRFKRAAEQLDLHGARFIFHVLGTESLPYSAIVYLQRSARDVRIPI